MGKKSTAMYQQVAIALGDLKDECNECDKLMDLFRNELREFADAPKGSPKRVTWYLATISDKLLPLTYNVNGLIGRADAPLSAFERFLTDKTGLRKKDLTKLKKTTLEQHTNYVIKARKELEAIRNKFIGTEKNYQGGQIAKYVKDIVAHCKEVVQAEALS